MPKEAKRRFVGLQTEEVSLVDAPANEVEFLVVKNQEDPSMSATATAAETKKVRVPLEVPEGEGGDAVAKALEHVSGIVDKISGLVNTRKETKAPKDGEGAGDGDDAEDGDGDTEETPTEKAASMKSVLEKCGIDTAMAKKVASALKAAGFASGAPPFAKKPPQSDDSAKTKKAEGDDDVDAPLTMAALASAVHKAAAFTPQRIKALQNAQDILKLVLEAVTPGTSPDSTVDPVQTHGNPSSVTELTKPSKKPTVPTMKSEEGSEVVESLKALSTAIGGLVDRVEAIEKTRPASNSLGEGGTDTNTKKSGSIWSGVL